MPMIQDDSQTMEGQLRRLKERVGQLEAAGVKAVALDELKKDALEIAVHEVAGATASLRASIQGAVADAREAVKLDVADAKAAAQSVAGLSGDVQATREQLAFTAKLAEQAKAQVDKTADAVAELAEQSKALAEQVKAIGDQAQAAQVRAGKVEQAISAEESGRKEGERGMDKWFSELSQRVNALAERVEFLAEQVKPKP